jgi:hypothetical protein
MAQLRGNRQCRGVAEAEVENRGADLVHLLVKPAHQLGAAEPRFVVVMFKIGGGTRSSPPPLLQEGESRRRQGWLAVSALKL